VSAAATFSVLPGLPGTGPLPLQFSASGTGTHREGYVVEFTTGSGQSWVGNFQPGITSLYAVFEEPTTGDVTVIAGGQAYVVMPAAGRLKREYGGGIEKVSPLPELNAVLISNGLWFELCRGAEELWCSRRLSWDGMRNVTVEADCVRGEGWKYGRNLAPVRSPTSYRHCEGR
jgi:hypothetical protein